MRVISFDIATKSLAYCVLDMNIGWAGDLLKCKSLEECSDVLSSAVTVLKWDVVDLAGGASLKSLDNLSRSRALRVVLESLDEYTSKQSEEAMEVTVLLEYQMSANYNANAVYNQVLYHFCEHKVITVHPTLKNKVWFSKDLKHQSFIAKYANAYTANKAHTRANLEFYCNVFQLELPSIKAKNRDDLADAFIQAMHYFVKYIADGQVSTGI
jgi:hypothetical protein